MVKQQEAKQQSDYLTETLYNRLILHVQSILYGKSILLASKQHVVCPNPTGRAQDMTCQ
jgi:hypothetical protein